MSADIIDLRSARAKRAKPVCSYHVRIDLYEDGLGGAVLDMGDNIDAETMRGVSENLFVMARHCRDMAWLESQDPDDRQLCVLRVYGSSRANVWTSDDIATPEQLDWLKERLDEAHDAIEPLEVA